MAKIVVFLLLTDADCLPQESASGYVEVSGCLSARVRLVLKVPFSP